MVIQNLIECKFEKVWKDVEHNSNGEAFVLEKRRITGRFSESMELQSFPFDTQCLSLLLTSEQQKLEFAEDNVEASLVNHLTFIDQQEWMVWDIVEFKQDDRLGEFSNLQPMQPMILVQIHATRKSGFFVWNLLAVMVNGFKTGTSASWSETWPKSADLWVAVTMEANKMAAKLIRWEEVLILRKMDKYILSSMLLMHLVCVWHAIICFVSSSSTLGDTLDVVGFIVLIAVFFLFQIIFVIVVRLQISDKRAGLQLMENEYKAKVSRLMGRSYNGSKQNGRQANKMGRSFDP
ncbi:uncharacterized protein LOC101862781 [Aplysia californica]|uniref:Uncharacterized protein LOC101862781 n=1 Tax=Aplysia californica TaxID=6500 RepID=A0ABM0JFV5_APLCA|nr:uncharacterized protein LOC101862781 [Aplysia californica]